MVFVNETVWHTGKLWKSSFSSSLSFCSSFLPLWRCLRIAIKNGDRIVTAGGVHGVVRGTTDTSVDLEVSPGVTLTFDKMAVVRTESEAQKLDRGGANNAVEAQRDNGENNNDDGFNGGEGEQPSSR